MWPLATPQAWRFSTPEEQDDLALFSCAEAPPTPKKMSFEEVTKVSGKPLDKAQSIRYAKQATEMKHLSENTRHFVSALKGP
jgi:hypothetical protein